jgi:hypothetical protein
VGFETVSTDPRFNRNFRALTSEYVLDRLQRFDEMLNDPANSRRLGYLFEQREWWEKQLPLCRKREASRCKERALHEEGASA